ncbi:carboxymuconolactone decarboxylase family protein [Amycolatopsis sp. QT-25]|uniref:carboxymuconolactone decarboxylase family protein n=1 Tax=Amycolatopsis sp. QT-25 TaxID=3034022 RepID=UPI0023EC456B|nr:carboxymuconolactone decarboxylase family protein [Amycolatopsis sp. QT-25]WET82523.1 carboxymuconolactone decarboxylase family protein [Amycolatopsis sp. QT-25]
MAGTPLKIAGRRSIAHIRHLDAVRPGAATGRVRTIYAQCERDFGLIAPPVSLHSPAPDLLAATWILLREVLVADGVASRAGKETVAAAVSAGNECPYCVSVHQATLAGLAPDGAREPASLEDWARAVATRDGAASRPAPFPAAALAEYAGTAVAFQYINRMATLFLRDSPLPPGVPGIARAGALKLLGTMMGTAASVTVQPGASLALLPEAELPGDLGWAAGNTTISSAYARAARAYETAGERSVPGRVRALVLDLTGQWDGEPPGLGRAWATERTSGLDSGDRTAGLLALLTALSPHQVGDELVRAYLVGGGDGRSLLELTSWASFTAARRTGSWLVPTT